MLFILEFGNNHNGSLNKGIDMVDQFHKVTSKFPQFDFAIKFQKRHLETFIHPDYIDKEEEYPYIKRFKNTQLSLDDFYSLNNYARVKGYKTGCTPFDEISVDEIMGSKFDYIKIGSCSLTDWSLLNKVVETKLPVIASTGGATIEDIAKVVIFFKNRQIPLSLLHCVGLYPSQPEDLNLDRITTLKNIFPNNEIGCSTHESPLSCHYNTLQMMIAKGVTIVEHHVDIDNENRNKYSINPIEFLSYLAYANKAIQICQENPSALKREQNGLKKLQRGAYLNLDVRPGDIITRNQLFFAMPVADDAQYTANDCSKYTTFIAFKNIKKGHPLTHKVCNRKNNRAYIEDIIGYVRDLLDRNYIVYPTPVQMEISHHYGLEKYFSYGMSLITLVNGKYCKKLLIVLPGQNNPEHYHKVKQETFFILVGEAIIEVEGLKHICKKGEIIHIKPGQLHSISSEIGTVIEELSTEHISNDSYYTDENINKNTNRKTIIFLSS